MCLKLEKMLQHCMLVVQMCSLLCLTGNGLLEKKIFLMQNIYNHYSWPNILLHHLNLNIQINIILRTKGTLKPEIIIIRKL